MLQGWVSFPKQPEWLLSFIFCNKSVTVNVPLNSKLERSRLYHWDLKCEFQGGISMRQMGFGLCYLDVYFDVKVYALKIKNVSLTMFMKCVSLLFLNWALFAYWI